MMKAEKAIELDLESRETLLLESKRKDVLEVLSKDRELAIYLTKSLDREFFGDVLVHLRENMVSVGVLTMEWLEEVDRQKTWSSDGYVDGMCLHTIGNHLISLGESLANLLSSSNDKRFAKTCIKEWLKAIPIKELEFALKSANSQGVNIDSAVEVLKVIDEEGYKYLLVEIMESGIVDEDVRLQAEFLDDMEEKKEEELSISDFL